MLSWQAHEIISTAQTSDVPESDGLQVYFIITNICINQNVLEETAHSVSYEISAQNLTVLNNHMLNKSDHNHSHKYQCVPDGFQRERKH